MKWIRSKINKDTIGSITKTLYNKTEWYRKNRFFNSMFFKYTVLFCITAFIAFLPFIKYHKSFIWWLDGQGIQYPAFVYVGKWLRRIIKTIANGHLTIPMYDFNLGMGADVLQSMSMWYMEPLSLITVIVPAVYAEYVHDLLVIVRLYLMGLSFIYMAKYFNKGGKFIPIGAIVYIFTGYTFHWIRHPVFFSGTIYLPILIVELDKLIRKKQISVSLILMVGLSLFTSYYFLYVNTFICGIYFLITIIFDKTVEKKFSNIFNIIIKIIISYVWGLALAMFIFIPTIVSYLGSNRTKGAIQSKSLLIYDYKWLPKLFVYMFAPAIDTGYWLFNNFLCMALVCLVIVFLNKGNKRLKILISTLIFMLCFPVFTYIAHGFGSINHRWNYAHALAFGLIVSIGLAQIKETKKSKFKYIMIPIIAYILIVMPLELARNIYTLSGVIFLLLSFGVVYMIRMENINRFISMLLISALIIFNSSYNSWAKYLLSMQGYSNEFIVRGSALNSQKTVSSDIKIDRLQQFERRAAAVNRREFVSNSMILDYMGISSYSNQQTKELKAFNDLLENRASNILEVHSLDNRTFLDTLSNVNYYTAFQGEEKFIPFGYSYVDGNSTKRMIYKNRYGLKFGYTYDSYITKKQFDKMSALQKQEVMLKSAYIGDDIDSDIKDNLSVLPYRSTVEEIKYDVTGYYGLTMDSREKVVRVNTAPAKMVIEFEAPKYRETYIRFDKLDIDHMGWMDLYMGIEGIAGKTSIYKDINVRSAKDMYTNRVYNYLVNLGYHEESMNKIIITFPREGEYKINGIKVYSQSMEEYQNNTQRLNNTYLKAVKWEHNTITGTVDADKEKLMCLTIPYSKGWKAYLDGKEVKIYKTNIMFSGILIPQGKHNVTLRYFTPGLKTGIIVSLVAWLSLSVYIVLKRKSKKGKVN